MLHSTFTELTNGELRHLARHKRGALHSWGFSYSQIEQILAYRRREDLSETTFIPSLTRLAEYYASPYRLNEPSSTIAEHTLRLYSYITPNAQVIAPEITITPDELQWNFNFEEPVPVSLEPEFEIEEEEIREPIESAHDLNVKYQETYGIYKNNKVCFINRVDRETEYKNKIYYMTISVDGSYSNESTKDISDFNMTLPKIGFINHKDFVVYLERKHKKSSPTRYRKGLRADGLTYTNLSRNEFKDLEIYNSYETNNEGAERIMREISNSLFFPKFYTYEEALSLLLSGEKLSCAISPLFALRTDFSKNKILLYKSLFNIGTYKPKTNAFYLTTHLFDRDLDTIGVPYELPNS